MRAVGQRRWQRALRPVLVGLLLALSTSVSSQTIVDDTAAAMSEPERKALFGALLLYAKDPISGQFAKLERPRPDVVCGLVNLRTSMGGYAGFQPFSFYPGPGRITIASSTGEGSPRSAIEVLTRIRFDCSKEPPATKVEAAKPPPSEPVKPSGLNADRVNYGCVEMTGEMLSQQAPKGADDRIIAACKSALLGSPSRASDLTRCARPTRSLTSDEAFMFKHICRAASDLLRKR